MVPSLVLPGDDSDDGQITDVNNPVLRHSFSEQPSVSEMVSGQDHHHYCTSHEIWAGGLTLALSCVGDGSSLTDKWLDEPCSQCRKTAQPTFSITQPRSGLHLVPFFESQYR
ncbi:hypothetical protein CDEST_09365 [Colletotrichum destructivum]|uniref:Uncharacterized protein n=1 Tax=Colletotrichum destructivum TaxID=34406 RepID=A0AAX4ILI4_9PEZI|nr:hypothetical protein CDEST_09365 [Colletotrichum destructivum]